LAALLMREGTVQQRSFEGVPTINLRVSGDELDEINRRVALHGYPNRTAFLVDRALSDDIARPAGEQRFEDIEQRLSRLEEAMWPRD
jgi:hypothetical protein